MRDFEATGFEALAPRTHLTSMAAFAYAEVDFGRVRLQFGGRIERNSYRAGDRMIGFDSEDRDFHEDDDHDHDDDHEDEDEVLVPVPDPRDRAFLGASGSIGVHVGIGEHEVEHRQAVPHPARPVAEDDGYVDARLTETNEPLPRIPPLRGTLQLDVPYGDFTLSPQLMYAAKQDAIFRGETETDGYSVLNVIASYTWSRRNAAHILSFTGYNLTNTLYRNHTSFIKDLAPEMGRGIKVGYTVRFF